MTDMVTKRFWSFLVLSLRWLVRWIKSQFWSFLWLIENDIGWLVCEAPTSSLQISCLVKPCSLPLLLLLMVAAAIVAAEEYVGLLVCSSVLGLTLYFVVWLISVFTLCLTSYVDLSLVLLMNYHFPKKIKK